MRYTIAMRFRSRLASVLGCLLLSCTGDPPQAAPTTAPVTRIDGGAGKRVFLTGETNGDMKNDPNAFCKKEAGSGEWVAFIATTGQPALASVAGLKGEYYEVEGSTAVFNLDTPLTPDQLKGISPERDIKGNDVSQGGALEIWIGNLGPVGAAADNVRCDNWRAGAGPAMGIVWRPSTDQFYSELACDQRRRVLCFEK
jgi:hypothetical protein